MEIISFLRTAQKEHGSCPFLFIFIEQGSPSVLQTHPLPWIWGRKRKQSGTKLQTALVAMSQSSPTQPLITQLL